MHAQKTTLESLVVESCVGLFGTLDVPLRPCSPESEREPLRASSSPELTVAILAFSGAAVRGTLALAATFQFLASCRPRDMRRRTFSSTSAGDWLYIRDWSKELANQLLGRIKRHLVARGLTFDIGTPSALTGDAASTYIRRQTVEAIRFVSGPAPVTVWLDVDMTPHASTTLATKAADALPKEGDVILF
jgi:hypothetical protein